MESRGTMYPFETFISLGRREGGGEWGHYVPFETFISLGRWEREWERGEGGGAMFQDGV